jgi:sterol 3beta-glucosyltransferase
VQVALLTAGTRGDVQPFLALARALERAGHAVRLAGPSDAAGLAAEHGVPFAPLGADYQALLASEEGRAMLANPLRAVRAWRGMVLPLVRATIDGAWAAAQGADLLVYHPKILGGADMAERLGARAFVATPVPLLTPTRAFPAPGVATRDLGGWLNRRSYGAVHAATRPFAGLLRRWRADVLGLPARAAGAGPYTVRGAPVPVLHAFSAHVVPRPADWPPWAHVTGFWFDEDVPGSPTHDWRPSRELRAFLDAGEPPVYVGFGSMAGRDPAATARLVLEAVRLSGVRAVVASGWGGLAASAGGSLRAALPEGLAPERVHAIEAAPHAWLFPRTAAVVHHGGAGTTAAGLRAGCPTVVCPYFGDQPFWGARVAALGAGPNPLPQRRLSADALAGAIRAAAREPRLRAAAEAVAARLAADDGVGRAVALIEGEPPQERGTSRGGPAR